MTTLAEARAALVTAVGAVDDYSDTTGCMVFSEGSPLSPVYGDGSVIWRWRVACYVGFRNNSGTSDIELGELVAAKVVILLGLAGWSLDGVSPAGTTQISGNDSLAADIAVSTKITLV